MGSLKSWIKQKLPPQLEMHLRAADHYWNGEPELRLLSRLVPRGRLAVDAGANIGTYSYFMRKYASEVVAYEPNPGLATRLQNIMPTVRVRNLALSEASGHIVLVVPVDASGRLCHEQGSVLSMFDEFPSTKEFAVDSVTLDSEALSNVGFIKVDVEQHEREVLRGAMQTIRKNRPVMLIEVYPLKYKNPLPQEFSFITAEGFVAWFRYGREWMPFQNFDAAKHARPDKFGSEDEFMANNVVFFPTEHAMAKVGPGSV